MKNNLSFRKKELLLLSIIFIGFFLFLNSAKIIASECDDKCLTAYPTDKDARNKCEDNCKDLEKKAKIYENILKVNDKQQSALNNQLEYIDQQQVKNQQSIQQTNQQLDDLSEKIANLEKDIAEKEKDINYQRKVLASFMQSYYDYDQQGLLEIVLLDKSISTSFSQTDYIEQTELKISDILNEIKNVQQELEKNKAELEDDYKKSSELKESLQKEKNNLQINENQKQGLLIQTQGEEQKYQQLLARVEEQKKQLFNFSAASNINDVLSSVSGYDRPDKNGWLGSSWYYSQRDSRWKNKDIGDGAISGYTMENWGCAIASVSMMETYYGDNTSPEDILKNPTKNFDGLDIVWSATLGSYKDTGYGYTNYKSKLNSILNNDDIAIIHIHVHNGGHFLIVGGKDKHDYIVHDPYFGANLYLETSLALMKKLSGSSAYVDRIIYK